VQFWCWFSIRVGYTSTKLGLDFDFTAYVSYQIQGHEHEFAIVLEMGATSLGIDSKARGGPLAYNLVLRIKILHAMAALFSERREHKKKPVKERKG